MMSVSNKQSGCKCVDQMTGMPLPSTPMSRTRANLDCSATTTPDFPKFCRQMPKMNKTCGVTETTRYYFDQGSGDCKSFTDMGCDPDNKNIFTDYQTCKSTCNSPTYSPKGCKEARLNCPAGKECQLEEGQPKCKDVRTPMASGVHYEPRCDSQGQFEPRQCQGDVCVCVNPSTGEQIPDSIGDGTNLRCTRKNNSDDVAVTKPKETDKKQCPDGNKPKFCKEGGDPCKNCVMPPEGPGNGNKQTPNSQGGNTGGRQQDSQTDGNGVCRNCGTCPPGQGQKKCTNTMCSDTSTCKSFPNAICRINKCTCEEEYVATDNKVVDCSAAQASCKRKQFEVEQSAIAQRYARASQGQSQAQSQSETSQLKCTADGAYEASCTGTTCHCLNATSGQKVGNAKNGANINTIDCSQTQRQTKAKQLKGRITVSKTKSPEDFTPRQQQKILSESEQTLRQRASVKVVDKALKSGSTILVVTVEDDPTLVKEGDADLTSRWTMNVVAPINNGEVGPIRLDDGTTLDLSNAETVEIVTEEDLSDDGKPMDDDDKKKKTTIIIVVVVVAVVVVIACVVAFYCYKKANSAKGKDIHFDNLTGKVNPTYDNA